MSSENEMGAVPLIQRFGSALNLNLHFHALFTDGVYQQKNNGELWFHGVLAPNSKHRINVTPAKRGKGGNTQGVQSKKSAELPVNERRK